MTFLEGVLPLRSISAGGFGFGRTIKGRSQTDHGNCALEAVGIPRFFV